jgi:site-specific DNA-methyltransferase (adenine-specific)
MNGPSLEKNVHQENKLKPLFSSLSDHWNTPKSLYEKLDQEFHFNYDPCPSSEGLHEFDGFGSWKERNFVNPPYSKVREWINHGYVESLKGKLCVFLVAARTDTAWFHDYVLPFAKEIRFIRGRLRFNDSTDPLKRAPFPSCIIIFDGRQKP